MPQDMDPQAELTSNGDVVHIIFPHQTIGQKYLVLDEAIILVKAVLTAIYKVRPDLVRGVLEFIINIDQENKHETP